MKTIFTFRCAIAVLAIVAPTIPTQAQESTSPLAGELVLSLQSVLTFLVPKPEAQVRAIELHLKVRSATGFAELLNGRKIILKVQPPNKIFVSTDMNGSMSMSSDGQKVWIHVPNKNLLIEGDETIPRFTARPESTKVVTLPSLNALPLSAGQIAMLPSLVNIESGHSEGNWHFKLTPKAETIAAFKIPTSTMTIHGKGNWPDSIALDDEKGNTVIVDIESHRISSPLPENAWRLQPDSDDKSERVALSHLTRFLEVALASIGSKIPTLPPAIGEKRLLGTSGKGRLESHDGTRVLFLNGTPEEMGQQQGTLLKKEIRAVTDRILYGVGVGSSFAKGSWFFGEIEEAVRRSGPFVDSRHLRELDAMADASGLDREESHLSNFFPELFHCSGFALLGKASGNGEIYHGRILDYLRGAGLEENAIVAIVHPEVGHAWVNIGYAGFTGSVTAMNEQHLSIGEMGGRGEGHWDGKPMAQLIREIMEKCATIDEAIAFMRNTPRTCEYYYVVSDAKSNRACGIKATPSILDVIWTGQPHADLDSPVEDAVVLSAGDRYKELVRRVKHGFGKFDSHKALNLMSRPVCMTSNIHSVLFAPKSLDFWVANADSKNVASETRFTQYNLRQLLDSLPAPK